MDHQRHFGGPAGLPGLGQVVLMVTLGSPKYAKLRERFWDILGYFGAGHQLLKSFALVNTGREVSGSGSSVIGDLSQRGRLG